MILVLSFLLFTIIPSSVYAIDDYASLSLSPSSGIIYKDYSIITVSLNTGTTDFIGLDYDLSFTGSVDYSNIVGSSVCGGNNMVVTKGSGTINVACVYTGAGAVYNGVVSTLYFKSTGIGSSVFTFNSTIPNIITKTGGTYTLSEANNPVAVGTSTTGALPESGIFDDTRNVVALGILLIFVGFFFNKINTVALLFIQKVKESKVNNQEKRVNERRGKLEQKF